MWLIKNACLIDMAGTYKENRDILIENGRISSIGDRLEGSEGCQILDAAGRLVTPGLIESHCHLGIGDRAGQDINEKTGPIHPELRAIDAVDLSSEDFKEALKEGVTTLATGPGSSNLIGGTFLVVKSAGKNGTAQIIKEELCMKMALGENPKLNYGPIGKMPGTRMGSTALIRKTLYDAKNYKRKWEEHLEKEQSGEPAQFPFDLGLHSLMRVFDGFPVKIHAHKANDIMAAMRIGEEFKLNYTVEHCTEGYSIIPEIQKEGIMVILGPLMGGKGKVELGKKRLDAPAIFEEAGVPFAIMTDSGVIPMEGLRAQAAILIRNGLSEMGAYRGLTIAAAKAIGLDQEIGSLEPGKQADLVIWDGEPFEAGGAAALVMIDGEIRYRRNEAER